MSLESAPPTPDARSLRRTFDGAPAGTLGIEDELMLVDPETLALAPVAAQVLARCEPEEPIKAELPRSQLEIVTPAVETVAELAEPLVAARRLVANRCAEVAVPIAAGVHPFSAVGELDGAERYRHTLAEYGPVAHRQLVCALQVHVAIGDAEAALAIYNSARTYLPLIGALAANAPLYEGADTGFASVRPLICDLLPRQGVPPPISSWEELADTYRWGARSGAFLPRAWWWTLRPHPGYGTLEFRVPDGQSTVADALAVAAVIQSLVAWLRARHEGGEMAGFSPTWRIEQNAWSAARHGSAGELADLDEGVPRPIAEALTALLDALVPYADALGAAAELAHARGLITRSGADRQRDVFAAAGAGAVVHWLAERFLEPIPG